MSRFDYEPVRLWVSSIMREFDYERVRLWAGSIMRQSDYEWVRLWESSIMSRFDYEPVQLSADLWIDPSFKTYSSRSLLDSYKTKDLANPENELFGSKYFKLKSFEVYTVEFD